MNNSNRECTRCYGEGYETYDEDGRMVTDACYHCGTTGFIDEDTLFHDKLMDVAKAIAYDEMLDYKRYRDNDCEGEDFAYCAAENMMSSHDYFTCLLWEKQDRICQAIDQLPPEMKEVLVAWDEYNFEQNRNKSHSNSNLLPSVINVDTAIFSANFTSIDYNYDEDNIPF